MGEREKLIAERDQLSPEYYRLFKISKDIESQIDALVFTKPENESVEIIAKIIVNEELFPKLDKLEREKAEVDAKRREIWKRILEINQILLSKK